MASVCQPVEYDEEFNEDVVVSDAVVTMFHDHVASLKRRRDYRKAQLTLRGVAASTDGDADADVAAVTSNELTSAILTSGDDTFEGDGVLRTLNMLLARIDERGYARSTQQIRFHDSFIRACSRVIYRDDWATNRPAIMGANKWKKCPSEILISTPRRFGKTFSIAIFAAALAMSLGLEIVIFSPARRASRKLLERITEFIRLLGFENRILEFNQEQLRIKSLSGKNSLIRSFPSKVRTN